jgi:hypothetical protein
MQSNRNPQEAGGNITHKTILETLLPVKLNICPPYDSAVPLIYIQQKCALKMNVFSILLTAPN